MILHFSKKAHQNLQITEIKTMKLLAISTPRKSNNLQPKPGMNRSLSNLKITRSVVLFVFFSVFFSTFFEMHLGSIVKKDFVTMYGNNVLILFWAEQNNAFCIMNKFIFIFLVKASTTSAIDNQIESRSATFKSTASVHQ